MPLVVSSSFCSVHSWLSPAITRHALSRRLAHQATAGARITFFLFPGMHVFASDKSATAVDMLEAKASISTPKASKAKDAMLLVPVPLKQQNHSLVWKKKKTSTVKSVADASCNTCTTRVWHAGAPPKLRGGPLGMRHGALAPHVAAHPLPCGRRRLRCSLADASRSQVF